MSAENLVSASLVIAATLILLMRAGLALYGIGSMRSKNAAAEALRQVCDLCVAALAFWAIGAALLLHAPAVLGFNPDLFLGRSGKVPEMVFLHLTLVLIATGIVSGAVAERARFFSLWAVSALLAGVILPVLGHWVWLGWLRNLGYLDLAGASVLHVSGGLAAAVAAFFVGPRQGKYNRDGSSNAIPGHNVPLASIGVLLLLVAWIPYIMTCTTLRVGELGVAPGAAALNTLLAAAAAGLTSLVYGRFRYGKPEVFLTYTGLLGGLVAISAAGGLVSSLSAVIIGAVAGLLIPLASVAIDLVGRIDDPSGGIAVHAVGGIWGTLAVAIFIPGGATQSLRHLGIQLLGLAAIAAVVIVVCSALFAILKLANLLRSPEADEFDGLDLAEHDINAYPDFQQTMIKSYHLREA